MSAKDKAIGYAIGYNDGLAQGGGGGTVVDGWSPPAEWIDIPDPEANQIVMLMDTTLYYGRAPMVGLWCDGIYGGVTIDCGNGQVVTIPEDVNVPFAYTYATPGQYIMTITSDYIKGISLLSPSNNNGNPYALKAIKVGANMHIEDGNLSAPLYGLVYAEFFGEAATYFNSAYALECIRAHVSPAELQVGCFAQCYNLKYIYNYLNGLTTLPQNCFHETGIEVISLPNVTNISYSGDSQHGISSCRQLKTVTAPSLTEISVSDFAGCYRLQELTLADGFSANGNTLSDCNLLKLKYN